MDTPINVYCDESCHLEHDGQKAMVIGAVTCPASRTREIAVRLREIKVDHGLPPDFETKWSKVSPGLLDYYKHVVNYFFDDDDLGFRALVVPDKSKLDHAKHNQTHDEFYYKMYFDMLKVLFDPQGNYYIYVDIKDTRGGEKVEKLHDVLCNSQHDFRRSIIRRIQILESHHVEQLQLADILIGIVSYANRGLSKSPAKTALVERMRSRSGYRLTQTTLLRERKVNVLVWEGR